MEKRKILFSGAHKNFHSSCKIKGDTRLAYPVFMELPLLVNKVKNLFSK